MKKLSKEIEYLIAYTCCQTDEEGCDLCPWKDTEKCQNTNFTFEDLKNVSKQ